MRHLYSLLMYLLTPWLLLRLWWKGRGLPAYRERIAERFSLNRSRVSETDIWVHAVSLGEVIAVTPLIDAMLEKKWSVLVTTMTPTGAERVKNRFGQRVEHRYVFYDLPYAARRFFKMARPKVGVIVETELWPNMVSEAARAQVPLVLVNARLSERSSRGYGKIKWLIRPVLRKFEKILAQSTDDAQRFMQLGADPDTILVSGNIKFDLQMPGLPVERFTQLKSRWGSKRTAVIIASTHDDEEQQILIRLSRLQAAIADVVLLIAPRHPERFKKVARLSSRMGFQTGLISEPNSLSQDNDVVILDSLGELPGFYQISNYAFVGGSLVPVGGHNVLEPIAMNIPVLSGKEVFNNRTICRDLQNAGAVIFVENADMLINEIIALHIDTEKRTTLVSSAGHILQINKGAGAACMKEIQSVLNNRQSKTSGRFHKSLKNKQI